MSSYETLTELIAARKTEEHKGITFILGDTDECFISYRNLYYTALRLLHDFQEAGFKPGDEVIFQLEDNRRFIYAFWACVLGGMIPVPVTTGANDEHKLKLFKIWDVLKNPRIVSNGEFFEKLRGFAGKNGLSVPMEAIEKRAFYLEEVAQGERVGEIHPSRPGDTAFIQFSSGSTGDPKGVIITHKNVLINLSSVISWAKIDSRDSGLNWMPLTHDMGLIGTHIKDVLACIHQYNIQTQLFIRHPTLWLQKAAEHKITLLYSPNFGYKHFLRFFNPEVERDWDLSGVRLIYNGAEPISAELCSEFLDKMARYGLKRNAMYPVYGLAEGTIAVTFPHPGEELSALTLDRNCLRVGEAVRETTREDGRGSTFVDVGYPIYNCFVRICGEDGRELEEKRVGHIQIRGGNVTSGYYNNEAATRQAITPDGWLNTGDLGLLRNGRLIVTGRAKDVIFVAGQNYYSHDIERVAEGVEGIELGKVAAVGVYNERTESDELVLFVLFKQKLESFIPVAVSLKSVINRKMGIELSQVIPVKNIPKTTSGKVQRYKLCESYIKGEFEALKREMQRLMDDEFNGRRIDRAENALEEGLIAIWSEILNVSKIGVHDNFFALGGDSLKVTQLISRIRDRYQVELDQADLFENPTVSALAAVLEKTGRSCEDSRETIGKIPADNGRTPLSFAQQRLWFLDSLNSGSAQYNLYTVLRFQGSLQVEALVKSLNEVKERHEILRASFIEENGQPVQVINNEAGLTIPLVDLSGLPEEERDGAVVELAREEAGKPFDLKMPPLIRGKLLRTGENEHVLILAAHHIIFDGWSFGILLRELAHHYEACTSNQPQALPGLKVQYPDYAGWQVQRVKEGKIDNQLAYWKKQLGGRLPVLELPADRQRPPVQTYNGARFTSIIPEKSVRELQSLAAKENATLFMALLAAFKVLLYRYTGEEDIIVGSPIANRNRKDIEETIGFFTNNLVLRTRLSGDSRFTDVLGRVRKVTLEAYANQDVPFEKLVEELHVDRDMSRNPLFQVLFGLNNTPLGPMELKDVNVSAIDIDSGFARFDLSLDIREWGGGLAMDFEYNTDLFEADTISRLAGHYRQLLEDIVQSPEKAVNQYEILTKAERNTLLVGWNETGMDIDPIPCWTRLFEAWADKTPDAAAVTGAGKRWTYSELNCRGNQWAHYLNSIGAGPESIIGVYLDRSPEMLAVLLGVHKAGCAYLPMDPIFPGDRLAYMLEDANAGFIITEKKLSMTLPSNRARVILIDDAGEELAGYSRMNPGDKGDSQSLAYLIYTSGSTGKPKGVQIEQRALINFLLSMKQKTGITENDSLLAITTLSFDIAGLELFMPLAAGARVVIADRNEAMDGSRLIAMLKEYGITMMQATPATWRLLLESGWTGSPGLKVLCGGEALTGDLAEKLLARCACLWNVYGPTETTIWSTMARVEADAGRISIGKPIGNTQVYILDGTMNPVPVGIPGELHIGGEGLARGYLNRPELTGEKFVPNPFGGSRLLYKTGDMVRYLPDGSIEFVGRADHQVKIRGFRIELGEIESVLNRNAAVMKSVVVAKEIIPGEKSLVAYIIPSSGQAQAELPPDSLRASLRQSLPDYMVPAAFVLMDAFPMTPNGKIDRKALPMPEKHRPQPGTGRDAASSETERRIAQIWRQVLKLEQVGMDDNFFDLGGHSLLLAQVRNKIGEVLEKDISMMDLFKYPTIRTLSRYLEGGEDIQRAAAPAKRPQNTGGKNAGIAVVGLSGRFPGAGDIEEFWANLSSGREAISRFTDEQAIAEGVDPALLKKSGYVKAWGALDNIDKFDAQFFGYNPREAEVLDPQQRVFLEESWKAIENAGYDPERFEGRIGVYASTGMNTYAKNLSDGGSNGLASDYQIMTSNDKDFLATRVAYKLNMEGPAITVQTACSSSLVAVHLACRSLDSGECDMAIAGGISIRLPQKAGYLYQEGMILSPDGRCRAFDEQAKGTVGGNGAGIVVLKRLKDALEDGDYIYAVIKGSAVNNDGAMKIGYTAPRADGQAKAIAAAQEMAGVAAETITYIEAHGTGTPLGDPIEIEALKQVFGKKTDKKGFCAIGSVKTNVGHLDAASGITGLIKTVLSLDRRMIPPSLNYNRTNPKIDFDNSPFFVNTRLSEWKNNGTPRRAGVSSFGIGGTNAHVVLEEAPAADSAATENEPCLLVFSAKTLSALDNMTARFADFLKKNEDIPMADAAYTLQTGRREFEHRRFLVCVSRQEAIEALEDVNARGKRVFENDGGKPALDGHYDDSRINAYTLEELGHFWLAGCKIDWEKLYFNKERKRILLPSYPFEGRSYWVEKERNSGEKAKEKPEMSDAKQKDISRWFYAPIWKQSARNPGTGPAAHEDKQENLLVLAGKCGFCDRFTARLRERKAEFAVAAAGREYKNAGDGAYLFDPENRDHYGRLLEEISIKGKKPDKIINLLGITGNETPVEDETGAEAGERLFYSMLYLAQAPGAKGWGTPVHIKALVNNSQSIVDEPVFYPGKALLAGACKVIPIEYPNIRCSSIDFVLPEAGSRREQELIDRLIGEVYSTAGEGAVAYRGMKRWIPDYEKIDLGEGGGAGIRLKPGGAYLITGGLGGIGLALAEYLVREVQAKLVLVSRTEFPREEEWEDWLTAHGPRDKTSQKIKKLRSFQAQGAQVLVCMGDVTDTQQMKAVLEKSEERFGRIDGLIHAAGIPGGGMIQMKKREFAARVLAPKVKGTMVLYEVFKDRKPDFFLFCSSLNAVTGGFGQADYSAANAFLDAFAHAHDSEQGTRVVSINWDRWPGVGMAAEAGRPAGIEEEDIHPLLGRVVTDTPAKTVYRAEFSPEKDWVLSEHLVMGAPTVPGTTYLEMARAAFAGKHGAGPVEIAEVVFLNPMVVMQHEKREVFTILSENGTGGEFRVVSRLQAEDGEKQGWQEHVRGRIAASPGEPAEAFDLARLEDRCGEGIDINGREGPPEEFISFGDRWRSLKRFSAGKEEALVEVGLSPEFVTDLEQYKLHPALMDVATGSVRLAAGGNFLPFSYGRLAIKGELPEKIYAHIRFKNGCSASQGIITSDINILDEQGRQAVEIRDFSMRLTGEAAAAGIKARASRGGGQVDVSGLEKLVGGTLLEESRDLSQGITPGEGREVLHRIFKGYPGPQVVVSTRDIRVALARADYVKQPAIAGAFEEAAATKASYPRPELDTEYVAPRNEAERRLAEVWQKILGIERVGTYDEFFALGGDSLLLIQLHSKLKEAFKAEIAVVDLYKYNTIASLAKYLNRDSEAAQEADFTQVNQRVNKKLELREKKRQQMLQRRGVDGNEQL